MNNVILLRNSPGKHFELICFLIEYGYYDLLEFVDREINSHSKRKYTTKDKTICIDKNHVIFLINNRGEKYDILMKPIPGYDYITLWGREYHAKTTDNFVKLDMLNIAEIAYLIDEGILESELYLGKVNLPGSDDE